MEMTPKLNEYLAMDNFNNDHGSEKESKTTFTKLIQWIAW